ncbi:hypothetical protein IWQ62_005208 [Dispira parvispora]|uniref:Uncharacterized protein n=1 Tax=Dispira parvispora TaxID=1520584 RepID=A0A9W8AK66_9FUNG|nr:hypothetical protein IWQ62_005208 [Dispira parvispora]
MKTRIVSVGFFALCFYALQSVQAIPTPNNEVLDEGTSRVCDELTESLTTAELEGPLGLVARTVCPNLNRSPNSLGFKSSLTKLNDDEFLSLLSTELNMFKYLVEQDYKNTLKESTVNRAQKQRLLVTGYRPATVNNDGIQRYATQGQHLKEMKVLPDDSLPVPAWQREDFPFNSFGFLASPKGSFVHLVPSLSESEFHKTGISLSTLSFVELLRTSPLLFFQRLTRHVESEAITKSFYARIQKVDFRQSFRKAMGIFADRYPLYFRDDLDRNGDRAGIYDANVLHDNIDKFGKMVLSPMNYLPALIYYDQNQLEAFLKQIFHPIYVSQLQVLLTLAKKFDDRLETVYRIVMDIAGSDAKTNIGNFERRIQKSNTEARVFGEKLLEETPTGTLLVVPMERESKTQLKSASSSDDSEGRPQKKRRV